MAKTYELKQDYDKVYVDKNKKIWKYYSNKKMQELFTKDYKKSIKVIGETVKDDKYKIDTVLKDYDLLSFGNVGVNKKLNNKIAGYIECENNEYVAVIKKRWAFFAIIFLVVLLLLAGIIFGINYLNSRPNIDDAASDYVSNLQRPDDWDPTKILIPGYDHIKTKYGENAAYVALWNPDDNPVYFQFDIILDETGESLYKTELIPPGKAVKKIPLSSSLKPGVYDITVSISSYSLENYKQRMNGAEVKTKLIITE